MNVKFCQKVNDIKKISGDCNHQYFCEELQLNFFCGQQPGHDGPHRIYLDLDKKIHGSNEFLVVEWDDAGNERPECHKEQGKAIEYYGDKSYGDKEKIVNQLIADAEQTLPNGKVYEIRERFSKDKNKHGAAWYYLPNLEDSKPQWEHYTLRTQEPLFLNALGEGCISPLGGYMLTGRLKTGEPKPEPLF